MNRQTIFIAAVTLALIGGAAALLLRLKASQKLGRPGVKIAQVPGTNAWKVQLPEEVLDFTSREMETTAAELAILPRDTTFGKRLYRAADGFEVFANVVLMGTDRTSIHKPEFCLTGQGWKIDDQKFVSVPVARPRPYDLPVRLFTTTRQVKSPDGRVTNLRGLYLFWFVADDALTASHWERQWSMGRELLRTGTLQRWAYVALLAVCAPGREEQALERMKQFIAAAVPEFQLAAGRPETKPVTALEREQGKRLNPRAADSFN
ncbi:MAG TPA: exosortase-associated EpsI family protein [Verrucomicrobiae bacterium]|jgi:hypothetical protein